MASLVEPASRRDPVATVHHAGTTCTVEVRGEIDISTGHELRAAVEEALSHRPETVVVDLTQVTFLDSTGVRTVLTAHRRSEATGVRLVIVRAGDDVHRVFELCGLDRRLPFVWPGLGRGSTG